MSYREFYDGYCEKTVLSKAGKIDDYLFFESEYAFFMHFDRKSFLGNSVVDFGGRLGEKTRKIRNVTVVEVDKSAREWMNSNRIKCAQNIDDFQAESIDVIYCSHVLEHLEDPASYLKKFYSKLARGGGRLILVLPAEMQIPEPSSPTTDANGHLQTWNFRNIMTSLDRCSFRISDWKMVVFPFQGIIKRLGGKILFMQCLKAVYVAHQSRIARFLFFLCCSFLRPLMILTKYEYSPEIIVIAEKG